MANERNRDSGKKQLRPSKPDETEKPDPSEIAAADCNEDFEPNDLGEAERVFEETNGGCRPDDV